MRILITGIAGFIGYHLALRLRNEGHDVYGFDNFNDYYGVSLKRAREERLKARGISVWEVDLKDSTRVRQAIRYHTPNLIVHLAAYAGVRHSYDHASEYILNNIVGTQNLIEACEAEDIMRVVYASTSCVMAGNALPWKEDEPVGHQLNPYGYTKRTNECQFMTSRIPFTTGLRFFTVYGPWGRPDMALFQFSDAIVRNKPITLFNDGNMKRDFTYIDDIVEGVSLLINRTMSSENARHEIFNIGRGQQVDLFDFVSEIEWNFGRTAQKIVAPRHPADTLETWSDTTKLRALGWEPKVSIPEGVEKFVSWYKHYYDVN